MQLTHLIAPLDVHSATGVTRAPAIRGIAFDSRRIQPGFLFVAIRGTQVDGHDFISRAVDAGAVAIVVSADFTGRAPQDLEQTAVITVPDTATALARLAATWYEDPSRDIKLVGITGTNGKTTVATLLHQLFTNLGYSAGLLSTVEIRIGTDVRSATHTTPDALSIQATLAEMRDAGVDYAFMEVSSHAVHQKRTGALHFTGGVFTNLSHDHLDYHGTFANYLKAKKAFFDHLPEGSFALTNADDRNGGIMLQNTAASRHEYSLRGMAEFRARLLSNIPEGLQLDIDGTDVFFKLIGRFNAYNLLAVYATALLLGQDRQDVLVILSSLPGPAGRMERVPNPTGKGTFLVDYAHTPDALENVLNTLRHILPEGKKLLCVVGAGGDRDRSKRPEMARIAARLAHSVILTSDNPRSEDPEAILDEMEAGVAPENSHRVLRITDRRQAIRAAVLHGANDVVLVAGKGHETYQEIKGVRTPFDDRTEIANALKQLADVD